jgi:hypothetical protein
MLVRPAERKKAYGLSSSRQQTGDRNVQSIAAETAAARVLEVAGDSGKEHGAMDQEQAVHGKAVSSVLVR